MTLPRFFIDLLVLPIVLDSFLTPLAAAAGYQGDFDADSHDCHEMNDDTGFMQQPVQVEVAKARGVVGSLEHGQEEGGEEEGSLKTLLEAPAERRVDVVEGATDMALKAARATAKTSANPGRGNSEPLIALGPDAGLSYFQVDKRKTTVVEEGNRAILVNDVPPVAHEHAGAVPLASSSVAIGEVLAPSRTISAFGVHAVSQRPLAYAQAVFIFAIFVVVVRAGILWRDSDRPRDALSRTMRQKLECMRVATGPEVRSAMGVRGEDADKASSLGVMRIQGRIVGKAIGSLSAPLSSRPCVQYSASVSQHRHDGVHQPPVSFHSAAREFSVQLEDCPEMLLDVQGQDVFPFDMQSGRYACELAFADAPDSWRSFLLAHLTPTVEGGGATGNSCALSGRMNCVDLGAKGPLKFRECALVVGARVTCVGEVVRERNGKLRLCPWSPLADEAKNKNKIPAMPWLSSKPDPWENKLMISDDSRLLEATKSLKCRSCL